MSRLRFLLRQHAYDADGGLLVRPGLVVSGLAIAAVALPYAEERASLLRAVGLRLTWAVPAEPAAVQVVLATIAGSVMTVVSIVYSVLIVAMSLASVQFSPRILAGFMRDRTSQRTLGLFIGTFTYCLLVLRSTHSVPEPFVPTVSVFGALVLALSCLGSLLFFVHHMAKAMQANHIVDRIASETEAVIDSVLPAPSGARAGDAAGAEEAPGAPESPAVTVRAGVSGYVQLLAVAELSEVARAHGVTLHVLRGMGQFVPEQGALVVADGPLDRAAEAACRAAFDLGPVRTMQDDLELGIRQIVDIALKAISPAVNDPSTAVTCIDHLSRLLGRIARRGEPQVVRRDEATGKALVVLPPVGFARTLDLALNQIRQYGKGDVAVVLRMVRALADVADMTADPNHLAAIRRHVRMLRTAAEGLSADDRGELDVRLGRLERRLSGDTV